jgi:hypothetical protein
VIVRIVRAVCTGAGLQSFGRHLRCMNDLVEPESSNIFSVCRLRSAPIVSQIMMVIGASRSVFSISTFSSGLRYLISSSAGETSTGYASSISVSEVLHEDILYSMSISSVLWLDEVSFGNNILSYNILL